MAGVRENKDHRIKVGPGLWPGDNWHAPWSARKRVGHRGPTRNGPPRQIQTRGPPRRAVGQWPSFVCGPAAPTVVIREY